MIGFEELPIEMQHKFTVNSERRHAAQSRCAELLKAEKNYEELAERTKQLRYSVDSEFYALEDEKTRMEKELAKDMGVEHVNVSVSDRNVWSMSSSCSSRWVEAQELSPELRAAEPAQQPFEEVIELLLQYMNRDAKAQFEEDYPGILDELEGAYDDTGEVQGQRSGEGDCPHGVCESGGTEETVPEGADESGASGDPEPGVLRDQP
jgi:hypothetical protein